MMAKGKSVIFFFQHRKKRLNPLTPWGGCSVTFSDMRNLTVPCPKMGGGGHAF